MPTQYYYVLLGGRFPGIYKEPYVTTCRSWTISLTLASSPVNLPSLPFCFVIQCGNFEEAENVFSLRSLVLQLQTPESAGSLIESLSGLLPKLMDMLEPLPRNLSNVTVVYTGHCRGIFLDR